MSDVTKFSTTELKEDLAETKSDILTCQIAISQGITEYKYRLDRNIQIEELIEKELERRGEHE